MNFADCKYIIFDLDGTLTDPKEGITGSAVYALKELGYNVPKKSEIEWFIGPPLCKSFMDLTGCDENAGKCLVEKYRERYRITGVHENILYSGIYELLSALCDDGRILAIASSKPTVFVNMILDDFKIARFFTVVEGSDLAGKHVEKEDVLSSALSKLGNNAVMIGDRKFDIAAAKKFGIKSIGVRYGYGAYNELEESGADAIVNSPEELLQILLCE